MKHISTFLLTILMSMVSTIVFAHDIEVTNSDGKNIYYNINSDGSSVSVTFQGTSSSSYSNEYIGEIVIPKTVTSGGKTYSVISIGNNAFDGCSGLTSVTIPTSVTSIGSNAFRGCSGLTSVTIPNNVTGIGNNAFIGCSGLTSIKVANGNNIYDSRNDCNAVIETASNTIILGCKTTIIPNSVSSIGDYAFCGCTGLIYTTIPENVTSIGSNSYSGCSKLKTVSFYGKTYYMKMNGATAAKRGAFHGCTGLTSIIMAEGIESVEESKKISNFRLLPGIEYIYIPSTVSTDLSFSELFPKSTPRTVISKSPLFQSYFNESSIKPSVIRKGDMEFFSHVNVKEYQDSMKNKNKEDIRSVIFFAGIGEDMTEEIMKEGMNPNCMYYIYNGIDLGWDNVIDIETLTAKSIKLYGGYAFDTPISFIADNIEYSYTPSTWADGTKGWETICIPFDAASFKASKDGFISPILLGASGDFWLRQFVGASSKALYFSSTLDGTMKANTPYLVAFPGDEMGGNSLQGQMITFYGKNATIDAYDLTEIQRNDKVFKGNYTKNTNNGTGWILNSDGNSFVASTTLDVAPFHAYIKNEDNNNVMAKQLNVCFEEQEEDITATDKVYADETTINISAADNGGLEIIAANDCQISIYSINGAIVRNVILKAGSNRIEGLSEGIYIINNNKVVIQ